MSTVHPAPRRVDLGLRRGSAEPLRVEVDPSLPAQGYRLTIGADGTTVEHRDDLGRRYALDTLSQIVAADELREGTIEDWPDVTDRAFMLDISRDRVPTMATLSWLVEVLSRLRFTELQLYTEHTFAWPQHEIVWRDSSPMTADEVRSLAATCESRGVTLVPCLNGFGHMERFLRHDEYRQRAECPDGAPAMVGDGIVPPTTLAPTADNAAFALDLFRGYLDALPSSRIHIGGDEPFELGLGASADMVAREGRAQVYARHLRRLVEPLVDDGHDVMFWGDVLSGSPDLVAQLPAGATAVAWWYDAPVPSPPSLTALMGADVAERMGQPDDALAGFVAHTRAFAESGLPCWVAPGTSSWNSFIGRWPNSQGNIDDAVDTAASTGARGLLLTDWGDGGHHQPLPVSLPPLVHASGSAWCRSSHDVDRVATVVDAVAGAPGLGVDLIALGSVDADLGVRQFNASALNQIVVGRYRSPRKPRIDSDRVDRALEVIDRFVVSEPLAANDRLGVMGAELDAACRLARVGVWRLASHHGLAAPTPTSSAAELAEAVARQERAWLLTSRPGGLDTSLARLRVTPT